MNYNMESILETMGEMLYLEENKTHEFSENYMAKKRELLPGNRANVRKVILQVAAVLVGILCVIPMAVLGAQFVKEYLMSREQTGKYEDTYSFEKSDSQNSVVHVKVMTDFPKEYKCVNDDKFLWSNNAGKELSLVLLYAKEHNEINVQNISGSKEINVGGHAGVYYDLQVTSDYDKQVIIFFEELGYAVQMHGTSHISEDELIELADGISLVETTWDEADKAAFVVSKTQSTQSQTVETVQSNKARVSEPFEMNMQTVDFKDAPVMINVIGAQVVDSLYDLEDGHLFGQAQDGNECKYINADGTLADYTRSIIKRGDGVNSLNKVILQENVAQKIVVVEFEITNLQEVPVSLWGKTNLGLSGKCSDDKLQELLDSESYTLSRGDNYLQYECIWMNGVKRINLEKGYRVEVPLKADETKTIKVAFVRDSDCLQDLEFIISGKYSSEKYCIYIGD